MKNYNIATIKGDGIGPEVVDSGIRVLKTIEKKFNHKFNFNEVYMGGIAIDKFGDPLPNNELEKCINSDSILLGAVGGPKWDNIESDKRPEKGLLKLRKSLEVYANLRPAKIFTGLEDISPLKNKNIKDRVDIIIVRELTGGIYFGEKARNKNDAYDIEKYSKEEIYRIAKIGFDLAMKRKKILTSIDKANVLESSKLWRETVNEVSKEYPNVTVKHSYIDSAAMDLVANPSKYDVIITTNMFGDILSDLLGGICGSLGTLASASIGKTKRGLYEPIHGSAPDIAGKNLANPIATILSVSMMLELSFGLKKEANIIKKAIDNVLENGYRTKDIYSEGTKLVGTKEITDLIIENIEGENYEKL